jgi:hypothetical protein
MSTTDAANMAEELYFNSNPPPKGLEHHTSVARDFIAEHSAKGTRVVLVSSGGTTVPLGKSFLACGDFCYPADMPNREEHRPLH